MITIVPFYKKINSIETSSQLEENQSVIDYQESLQMLVKSFLKYNPTGNFKVATDELTSLSFPEDNLFRSHISHMPLMESLTVSNTNFVKENFGKILLCGSDQLIAKPLDNLFNDDFDIGILSKGNTVNNTAVLVNSNKHNKDRIDSFFKKREELFYSLNDDYKSWGGDQYSYTLLLKELGIELNSNVVEKRFFQVGKLKIKIFNYNVDYVYGSKKSGPAFNKLAYIVDFKGSSRKRWIKEIYKTLVQ